MSTSEHEHKRIAKFDVDRVRLSANSNLNLLLATYGAKWTGRKLHCPWPDHDDKHAGNCSVKNGNIKCWSCGKSGDCFSLVMDHDRCTFPEAVRKIAQIYGINL